MIDEIFVAVEGMRKIISDYKILGGKLGIR
jgi:hypothetical protein